ncbi:transmembrane protein 94 isoform X2 [Diabrotica virgifera virgifera]|uniref:Transmembrane protein 94 n=1 Tax=Diabrotica virgifera virgifera TaxID=50390 RepID=A0ABM5KIH4_DIAVI|nr:transmembrane protein 94 isoform X2 [Diabrotica virgifera virgifera]
MEHNNEDKGLKTDDAINKLCAELSAVLDQYEISQKNRKSKSWLKDALSFRSKRTTINAISIVFGLWTSVSLIVGYILEGDNLGGYEAIPVIVLFIVNIILEIYDNKLRHQEIPNRIRSVLENLEREKSRIKWSSDNYPDLYTPYSPCITLQWTYRDGKVVNLPWALLVKGDVIVVKPGQISPGYCEALEKQTEIPLLHAKEVYAPTLQNANEVFSAPKYRKPLEPKKYRLLETPYLNNLKIFLEQALDRPVSQLNQQRHLVTINIVEQMILPFTFVLVLVINLFRYFYFHKYFGRYLVSNTLFIVPCNVILPLLPMIFPLFWNLTNYIGTARIKTFFDATTRCDTKINHLEEDADGSPIDDKKLKISRREVLSNFWKILRGKPEILTRSTNILHVLGSVTALGCVDKKGILSWPNPTAEKIFFLHNQHHDSHSSSLDNVNDLSSDIDSMFPNFQPESPSAVTEVLDLTHRHNDPFKLHFDDQEWNRYLSNLKPLGLAILLNTCNIDTKEHYNTFCSHITCEAMYNENLVPVTNRRCLCELANEIGFVDQAQKIFTLQEQLSSFRHLQTEMMRRDNKYARSLQLSTKLKFPFPHMFAVIVQELSTGNMQLLSEGTADIILDSCVDYWDGRDLIPLSNTDRKRIQDFYQRSSLTAYCTAFAYRPLAKNIHNKLSEVYLELPSDSRHLYLSHRSPTPVHWDIKSVLEPKTKSSQFYSADSLLFNDCQTDNVSDAESCFQVQCNQIFIGMITMQYQALIDMVHLIEQLERACIRFVHFSKENELRSRVFSEKMGLESGWNCHISLLSERNRGENCGQTDASASPPQQRNRFVLQNVVRRTQQTPRVDVKSLLIDSNLESSRTMSFSAPSAINMEFSTVKFEKEVEKFNIEKKQYEQSDDFNQTSQESVLLQPDSTTHEWQSLSNLTESTEHSAPINFDMSNRAKLPRGIDKIRPHIELIDNVPLLVSLFTDCTPDVTREMLQIMQDYKEVVCIMGSAENCDNAGIFMQADASMSIAPLYPQVCQKAKPYKNPEDCPGPIDISCQLNSIPCSLSIKRDSALPIYRLIMESRHFVASIWNSGQFWLCCCIALSVLQVFSTVLMLPGLLTTGQVLWFSCMVVPLISVSLMARPLDQEVMKKPLGKNQNLTNWNAAVFILWCYGTKFLVTFIVVLTSYIGILASHCGQKCLVELNCTCAFFYNPVILTESVSKGGWDENEWTLLMARLIISFIILLHFVVISVGFIHRDHLVFQKSPHTNLYWLISISIVIIVQCVYSILVFRDIVNTQNVNKFDIPRWVIIFAAISPVAVLIVNEIIKRQEIMVKERFLKRARLDFGTKLGMNSPF